MKHNIAIIGKSWIVKTAVITVTFVILGAIYAQVRYNSVAESIFIDVNKVSQIAEKLHPEETEELHGTVLGRNPYSAQNMKCSR